MSKRYCVLIAVACLAAPAMGQWREIDKPLASDETTGDYFGQSVCISGDTLVIGAYLDHDNGYGSGSAYVFQKTGSNWVQAAKLLPSDGDAEDLFGCCVSISGDTIVVGAHDAMGASHSGAAYVFVRPGTGWSGTLNEDAKLIASDGHDAGDFGKSVSISGDTIAVGAIWGDGNAVNCGSAYVFVKPDGGWSGTLDEDARLLATDGAYQDYFGRSISVSGDTIVVGALYNDGNTNDSGSAYVFVRPGSGWSGTLNEDAKLLASDGAAYDCFGKSVSISGDTIVVGAHHDNDNGSYSGSACVFVRPGTGWSGTLNEDAKLLASDGRAYDYFGASVSISGDTIVVGAYGDDDSGSYSGSVCVFVKPGTGWSGTLNENAKLLASDGEANDYFGCSVSVSEQAVVSGADRDNDNGYDAGSAYVHENDGSGWTEVDKLLVDNEAMGDHFGCSACVSGSTMVVGAHLDNQNGDDSGSAYVFQRSYHGWRQVAKLLASDGAADDHLGYAVSISGDTVVVGAYGDDDNGDASGSAYVFVKPAEGWSGMLSEDAKLLTSDAAAGDEFGWSVSISGDAIVIGAHADDDHGAGTGSAYIFVQPGGGWAGTLTEHAKLMASDGVAEDGFGQSVSISGDTAVVGAFGDDDNGSESGSAYVFVEPSGGWSGILNEDAKLLAADGVADDGLGNAVSTSGDTVVVGAYRGDDSGTDSGSVYVFEKPGAGWSGTLGHDAKLLASDGAIEDYFGISVSVSNQMVVIGASRDDDNGDASGSAYVFEKPAGGWSGTLNEETKLLASDGAPGDEFGSAVCCSGSTVVVGAPGGDNTGVDSGSTYMFMLWRTGDMNCDGTVNNFDIDAFICAMANGQAHYDLVYPDCNFFNADIEGDGSVSNFDIDPFIALLVE